MEIYEYIINLLESFIIMLFLKSLVNIKSELGKLKMYLLIGLFTFISFTSITFINSFIYYEGFLFIVDILLNFLFVITISNDSIPKNLSTSILPSITISIVYSTSIIIFNLIVSGEINHINILEHHGFLLSSITILAFFIVSKIVSRLVKKYTSNFSSENYFVLFLMLFCLHFLFTSLEYILFFYAESLSSTIIGIVSLIGFTLLSFILIKQLNDKNLENIKQIYENKMLTTKLEDDKKMLEVMKELQIIKHDLGHILITLEKKYNNETINKIIKRYKNLYKSTYEPVITNSQSLNDVLNIKMKEALSNNIDFITEIMIKNKLPVKDEDLGLVLINLLDNAIIHIGNERKIKFNLIENDNYFCFDISNSINGSALDKKNELKNTNKGLGIISVKNILRKYKTQIFYEEYNNELHAYFSLKK